MNGSVLNRLLITCIIGSYILVFGGHYVKNLAISNNLVGKAVESYGLVAIMRKNLRPSELGNNTAYSSNSPSGHYNL